MTCGRLTWLPCCCASCGVGALLGVLLGGLGFALASVFYDVQVATVIGLTLVAVCTLAATIGGVMPLAARAIKVDPAVFSNPFITTFVDASGLITTSSSPARSSASDRDDSPTWAR